jgi:hypothetical protein
VLAIGTDAGETAGRYCQLGLAELESRSAKSCDRRFRGRPVRTYSYPSRGRWPNLGGCTPGLSVLLAAFGFGVRDLVEADTKCGVMQGVEASGDEFEEHFATALLAAGEYIAGEQGHFMGDAVIAVDGSVDTAAAHSLTDTKHCSSQRPRNPNANDTAKTSSGGMTDYGHLWTFATTLAVCGNLTDSVMQFLAPRGIPSIGKPYKQDESMELASDTQWHLTCTDSGRCRERVSIRVW